MSARVNLSDFRNVLGFVNDGNVVLNDDKGEGAVGVRKVNHGGFFMKHIFRATEQMPDNLKANLRARSALFAAILNSREGKIAGNEYLEEIKKRLGLDKVDAEAEVGAEEEVGAEQDAKAAAEKKEVKTAYKPLDRRELQAILDDLDSKAATLEKMLGKSVEDLKEKGLGNDSVADWAKRCVMQLKSPEEMRALLPKQMYGFTKDQITKFLQKNFNGIRTQMFDRIYWIGIGRNGLAGEVPKGARNIGKNSELLTRVVREMMQGFAARKDPLPLAANNIPFPEAKAEAELNVELKRRFEKELSEFKDKVDMLFGTKDGANTPTKLSLAALGCRLKEAVLGGMQCAYETCHDAGDERKFNAALNGFNDICGELMRLSAKNIRNLGTSSPDFIKSFRESVRPFLDTTNARYAEIGEDRTTAEFARKVLEGFGPLADAVKVEELLDERLQAQVQAHGYSEEDLKKAKSKILGEECPLSVTNALDGLRAPLYRQRKLENAPVGSAQLDTHALDEALDEVFNEVLGEKRSKATFFSDLLKRVKEGDGKLVFEHIRSLLLPSKKEVESGGLVDADNVPAFDCSEKLSAEELKILEAKLFVMRSLARVSPELSDSLRDRKIFSPYSIIPTRKNLEELDKVIDTLPLSKLKIMAAYQEKDLVRVDWRKRNGKLQTNLLEAFDDGIINADDLSLDSAAVFVSALEAYERGLALDEIVGIVLVNTFYDEEKPKGERGCSKEIEDKFKDELIKGYKAYSGADPKDPKAISFNDEHNLPWGVATKNMLAAARGFGTDSVSRILGLMQSFELKVSDLKRADGMFKYYTMQHLAYLNDFKLDGLREWAERVCGKAASDITFEDIGKLYRQKDSGGIKDPLQMDLALAKNYKEKTRNPVLAANFLSGRLSIGEAGLFGDDKQNNVTAEAGRLMEALRSLKNGNPQPQNLTVCGTDVTLTMNPETRQLTARVDMSKKGDKSQLLPIHVGLDVDDLLRTVENEIVTHPDSYSDKTVKSVLPDPKAVGKGDSLSRARELYAQVLSAKLGVPAVRFASMASEDLGTTAVDCLSGKFTVDDLPKGEPAAYNNAEVIELHQQLLRAKPSELKAVNVSVLEKAENAQGDDQKEITGKDIRYFVADLMMNRDTWSFDNSSGAGGGERLERILKSYAGEIAALKDGSELLDGVPAAVRKELTAEGGFIDTLKNADGKYTKDLLDRLDQQLDAVIENAMGSMQKMVNDLFGIGERKVPVEAQGQEEERELQQLQEQTLSEVSGASGLDENTQDGRFARKVLGGYFSGASTIEKRAMLASMLRGVKDGASADGEQVAELLKGAGPLLQKMLQGLPIETFGPETRTALKDMKSKLGAIPSEVVKAQMLELMRTSGGKILGIEVKKSIGAATIGQAFLCHLRTKEHPINGEDVVIKLLRPNVSTAVQREYKLMAGIAKELEKDPQGKGTLATFEGQYKNVLAELDFTLEAKNIDLGGTAYETPVIAGKTYNDVHSMGRVEGLAPTTGALVLKKVAGSTFDGFVEDSRNFIRTELQKLKKEVALGKDGPVKTVYGARDPGQLGYLRRRFDLIYRQATARRESLERLTQTWIEEALFGTGFFHCDMHSGNIMSAGHDATVIDYGSAMRLGGNEQKVLVIAMAACMTKDADNVLGELMKLIPDNAAILKENGLRDRLLKQLKVVLNKGTSNNVLERFLGALTVMQRSGLPIPGSVSAFIKSAIRLKAVFSAVDDLRHEAVQSCEMLELDPDVIARYTHAEAGENEKKPELSDLDKFLSSDLMKSFDRALCAYADVGKDFASFKERISETAKKFELLSDRNGPDAFNEFFNKFQAIFFSSENHGLNRKLFDKLRERYNFGFVRTVGTELSVEGIRYNPNDHVLQDMSELTLPYEEFVESGKGEHRIPEQKKNLIKALLSRLGRIINQANFEGQMTFAEQNSLESTFINRMLDNAELKWVGFIPDFQNSGKVVQYAVSELGFSARSFAEKVSSEQKAVKDRLAGIAEARKGADTENTAPGSERLGASTCSVLASQAGEFVVPSSADLSALSDEELVRTLVLNVDKLRTRLQTEVDPELKSLTANHLKYYATMLNPHLDGKLAKLIKEKNDQGYLALVGLVSESGDADALELLKCIRPLPGANAEP